MRQLLLRGALQRRELLAASLSLMVAGCATVGAPSEAMLKIQQRQAFMDALFDLFAKLDRDAIDIAEVEESAGFIKITVIARDKEGQDKGIRILQDSPALGLGAFERRTDKESGRPAIFVAAKTEVVNVRPTAPIGRLGPRGTLEGAFTKINDLALEQNLYFQLFRPEGFLPPEEGTVAYRLRVSISGTPGSFDSWVRALLDRNADHPVTFEKIRITRPPRDRRGLRMSMEAMVYSAE
jgi:hypothetical protein